jgi:hypothetical protein
MAVARTARAVARPSFRPLVLVASLLLGAIAGAVATTKHETPRPPATHPRHAQVHVILAHDVVRVAGSKVSGAGVLT